MEGSTEDVKRLEDKMEKLFDDMIGKKDGLVKVASPSTEMSNQSYKRYRSSFLTLGDMQIPDDYRKIFRWCRYFFKFDSLIGPAVRALATFPITDIIYQDTKESENNVESEEQRGEHSESYKFYTLMFKELGLYNHLFEIGYDYFLYGNCVIFAEPGIKTIRRRNEMGEIYERKEVIWKSLERLDLTRLKLDRDPKTKQKVFYYDLPPDIKKIIKTKTPKEKYNAMPEIFKKAVAKKGVIKLNPDYVFHFAMPAESGEKGLWATPPVLHALKLVLYTNILRQAQEAIAYEHIVPRRIYYFQETQNFAPEFNFSQIAEDFAYQLKRQLNDPNYQVISPIPLQQIQHGGNGRALLLVPEIDQLQNTILAAMGVPREFVFGGMSYSGSTTSLRILENNFITYRTMLNNYVNDFLIKKLAQIRGEWETIDDDNKVISVEFSELKMQDDIQQKQLLIQLNAQGKIPDEILYEKVLGLDAEQVIKMLKSDRERAIKEQAEQQMMQMQLQMQMQQQMQAMGMDPNAMQQGQAQQGQAQEGQPQEEQPQQGQPEEGQPQQDQPQQGQPQQGQPQQGQPQQGQPQDGQQPGQTLNEGQRLEVARQMLNMSEAERANLISKFPQEDSKRIMMYYQELKMNQEAEQANEIDMRPMPEQLPPRRQGGV
jgi:hypothetical protein